MKINYKLDKFSASVLQDINDGINILINGCKTEYPDISSQISSLSGLIMVLFGGSNAEDNISSFKQENPTLANYSDFLAKSCVLAYLQKFDNDKNLEAMHDVLKSREEKRLREKFKGSCENEDELNKKIEEFINFDYKFGFSGLYDIVLDSVEVLFNSESNDSAIKNRVDCNLLTNMREISPQEYLEGDFMRQDILLIAELGNKSKEEVSEIIYDFIKTNPTYNKYLEETVDLVLGIYKYLFQDSFGLRPYIGVLSFNSPFLYVIDESFRLNTLKKSKTEFNNIGVRLKPNYEVIECPDRQFNVKEIMFKGGDKPRYYPKKILEYAMGRQLTYELSENIYRPCANNVSWEAYQDAYVKGQVEKILLNSIYYSLEHNFDKNLFKDLKDINSDGLFLSDNFGALLMNLEDDIFAHLCSDNMRNLVYKDVSKVVKSMCTAVVVIQYNNLGNTINSIGLRICDTTETLSPNLTKNLFSCLAINDKIVYDNGDIISEGKQTLKSQPLPFAIFDFKHDFDSALSNAEPLFGYTAVELYQKRGIKLGWDRILLGEDIKGTPLFASESVDDIHILRNTVHNVIAGSRAGKGVMTMNILASAVVSDIPIFYIDRKPDMAVMLSEISEGNMFVINGGQYEEKNDPRGIFNDKGSAIAGWEDAYANIPSYLNKIFPSKTYAGNFGDMVYYRACMLMFGILMARVECPAHLNDLGGQSGITVIIDEFKNWQVGFESTMFTVAGEFCNGHRAVKEDFERYRKTLDDIKVKKTQLEVYSEDPKKKAEIMKLQLSIDALQSKLRSILPPEKIYATTITDKLGQSVKHMAQKFSAGYKDSEGKLSNIFVIGQHIDINGYDGSSNRGGLYSETSKGEFNNNTSTKGTSLMRGILEMFPGKDWLMGYNHENSNTREYLGANNEGSRANKWIDKRQYWGYCDGDATMEQLRTSAPSNIVYFKPYLVLNNAKESDPNNPIKITIVDKEGNSSEVLHPDYTFVDQCRDRVNKAVPGANLWETVRLKHLQEGLAEQVTETEKFYGCLKEGIGFEGLINQMMITNGRGNFNPKVGLGKSKEIADYVAKCMGYSSYKELLFDFTPQGLFSTEDVVAAINNPEEYQSNIRNRIPLFYEYGILGDENVIEEDTPSFNGNNLVNDGSFEIESTYGEEEDNSITPSFTPSDSELDEPISSTSNRDFMNQIPDNVVEEEPIIMSDLDIYKISKYIIENCGMNFNDKQMAIKATVNFLRGRGW